MGGASFFYDLSVGQTFAADDDVVAGAQGVAVRALGDETVAVGLVDDLDRFFLQLRRRDDVDEGLPVAVHVHGLERYAQTGVLTVDDVGRGLAHGQRVGQRIVAREHDRDLAAAVRFALAEHGGRDRAAVVLREVERGAAAQIQAVGVGLAHDGGEVPLFRRDELADRVCGRRGTRVLERGHAVWREVFKRRRAQRLITVHRGGEQPRRRCGDAAAADAGLFQLVQLGVERVEIALRDGARRGAEEQRAEVHADVVKLGRAARGDGGVELQDGAVDAAVKLGCARGAARA